MNRFGRWLLFLVVTCALCLPPRLHAQAASGGGHHAAVAQIAIAQTVIALPEDCHTEAQAEPGSSGSARMTSDHRSDGAYLACLIACASLPAQVPVPGFLWRAGACEQLRPHLSLSTPAPEPEGLLRPPIRLS